MSISSQDTDLRALPADVDLSQAISQYTFISMAAPQNVAGNGPNWGAATNYVEGTRPYGVLQNLACPPGVNPLAETVCAVRTRNISKLRCGGAWEVGDSITAMAGGLGKKAGDGDIVRGIACSAAAVGDVASVDLI